MIATVGGGRLWTQSSPDRRSGLDYQACLDQVPAEGGALGDVGAERAAQHPVDLDRRQTVGRADRTYVGRRDLLARLHVGHHIERAAEAQPLLLALGRADVRGAQ